MADIFIQFYTPLVNEPDALCITWTGKELEELGQVYARVAPGSDIMGHLSRYSKDPAGAVASVLPSVSAEDIICHDKLPPIVSRSKNLLAIDGRPCSIRASMIVISTLGVLILQRAQEDSFGGMWDGPGGQVNAGERVSQGGLRELLEETGLTGSARLTSFNRFKAKKDHRLWYDFSGFAEIDMKPGWERHIRLSKEHQGFSWTKKMKRDEYAPGWDEHIQRGLNEIAARNVLAKFAAYHQAAGWSSMLRPLQRDPSGFATYSLQQRVRIREAVEGYESTTGLYHNILGKEDMAKVYKIAGEFKKKFGLSGDQLRDHVITSLEFEANAELIVEICWEAAAHVLGTMQLSELHSASYMRE
ncbi:hypothetical protein BJX99DRAFT_239865 [Aspergillus californicus]